MTQYLSNKFPYCTRCSLSWWYVVIENLPGVRAFSNTHIIEVYANQSMGETLYSLFIAPAAFQLWFLRDLMVMLLFTSQLSRNWCWPFVVQASRY